MLDKLVSNFSYLEGQAAHAWPLPAIWSPGITSEFSCRSWTKQKQKETEKENKREQDSNKGELHSYSSVWRYKIFEYIWVIVKQLLRLLVLIYHSWLHIALHQAPM